VSFEDSSGAMHSRRQGFVHPHSKGHSLGALIEVMRLQRAAKSASRIGCLKKEETIGPAGQLEGGQMRLIRTDHRVEEENASSTSETDDGILQHIDAPMSTSASGWIFC
jgi:hypothetical protein